MFSEPEVRELAPRLKELEAEEPLVCCWRCMGGEPSPPPALWRVAARRIRDITRSTRRVARPAAGQVVVVGLHGMRPSAAGNLKPVLAELKRRGRPAFLVVNQATRGLLTECLHQGHVEASALEASIGWRSRLALRRRATGLASELRKRLPRGLDGYSDAWIASGLTMREAAEDWLGGAGPVLLPVDLTPRTKALALAAKRVGTSSVVVQHGMIGPREFPVHASRMYCWGEWFCDQARKHGAPEDQPVAVGCPRFDPLAAMRDKPRDVTVRGLMGGGRGKLLVLVISTAHAAKRSPELYGGFLETLQRLLEGSNAVALKLHPGEKDASWYAQHLPEQLFRRLQVVPPRVGLHEALRHVDVALHVYSAAALEALLVGCPLLTQSAPSGRCEVTDLPDHGGGFWTDADRIVEQVRELGQEGEGRLNALQGQEAFLSRAFANQGRATVAVVDRLLDGAH